MTSSTTPGETKRLLTNVKRYPCIYDRQSKVSREGINMAWKEISSAMQNPFWTVQNCQSKWKALQDEVKFFDEFGGHAGTEGDPSLNIVPRVGHCRPKSVTMATDVRQTHPKENHWKPCANPMSPGTQSDINAYVTHHNISTPNKTYLRQSRASYENHDLRCSGGYNQEFNNQSQHRHSDGFHQSRDSIFCYESRTSTGQLPVRSQSKHEQPNDFTERYQTREFADPKQSRHSTGKCYSRESTGCCPTRETVKCHQSRNSEDQWHIKSHQDTSSSGNCESSVLIYHRLSDYSHCQPREAHSSTQRQKRHSVDCHQSSDSNSSQKHKNETEYHIPRVTRTNNMLKDPENCQSSKNSTTFRQSRNVKESKGKKRKIESKAATVDTSSVNLTWSDISIPLFFQSLRPVFLNMNATQKQKYKYQVLDYLRIKKQKI